MSLSFLNRSAGIAALLVAVAAGSGASAADKYWIPEASVSAEYHTNLDLTAGPSAVDQSVPAYVADLAATFGVRSQRGLTEFRPNVQFQEYPDRSELQRANIYADLRSEYEWLRAHFDVVARYAKEDEYKSQLPAAAFDTFDPKDPNAGGSGEIISVSESVERIYVRPTYLYRFTERFAVGATGNFESVDYNLDFLSSDRVDYDYMNAQAFLLWAVGQRSSLTTGIYKSRYEADRDINTTKAVGVESSFEHRWTETFKGTLTFNVEKTDVDEALLPAESSTNFGFLGGVERRGQVSRLRFEAGRSYMPSSNGTRASFDQVRGQYYRQVTQRWSYGLAARFFRSRGEGDGNNDRDYARGSLTLSRALTPTWSVSAGYDYLWQKYARDDINRSDNTFRVSIGYRGLDPQR
ncbi:MAG: hypothetical protein ABI859_18500 [Pseudomonadota bacterium]